MGLNIVAVSPASPGIGFGVYGRLAHKDDPLQVSAGRPAPTIGSSEPNKTSENMYYFHLYSSSCRIPSIISLMYFVRFPNVCSCDL